MDVISCKVAIIGAGAGGLSAAWHLTSKGFAVELYEESKAAGGLASVIKAGGLPVERFYHHIFNSDSELIWFVETLGLKDKLIWKKPANGIYINKKLYPFTTPLNLLMFPELKLLDRVALGLLVLKAGRQKEWKQLESMTAKEWIIKNAGKRVYDNIWGPLLKSKFEADADDVSAVWLWNKLKLRGSTRSKGMSHEMLGYMKGGFGQIYEKQVEDIKNNGGVFHFSSRVTSISKQDDGFFPLKGEGFEKIYSHVLFTGSPGLMLQYNLPFPEYYINKLRQIRYKSNICVLLEMKESMSPYYWITVAENDAPFVLVIEHSNFITEGYDSKIVYLSRYLDSDNELFGWDDSKITEAFFDYLRGIFPDFKSENVLKATISRASYAQPFIACNYSNIIPPLETPLKNLYIASMAQIYPEDRGQNYAMRIGREAAEAIMKE